MSEFYRNAQLYDQIFPGPPESHLFLAAQAQKSGGPILELACGTGILTLPLARRGYAVTGLDMAAPMLDYARVKENSQRDESAPPVNWVLGDMRNFDLGRRFRLIVLLHNSVSHLHTLEDFCGAMACVRAHLEPDGRFLVNTFVPDPAIIHRPTTTNRQPIGRLPDPQGHGPINLLQENVYDPLRQINTVRIFRQLPAQPVEPLGELQLRMYFPQEFDALLQWNGFTIERKFGNYRAVPFGARPGESAQTQLCVCRLVD